MSTAAATSAGALQGTRIIDLSRVLGGPYCTQILGDHGAEVYKIEHPTGDETRGWGPPFQDGTASYFLGVNRNKRGLSLDLSQAAGQAFLRALLRDADVLVENFKPGTLEKWGLGYDVLSREFPQLIHCRISGFGADGPLGGLPGYDACAQALCGLMSVNGDAEGEPTRIGVPVVDMVTGLNAALAVLLALNERQRSGLGQFLDITLFDCAISPFAPARAQLLPQWPRAGPHRQCPSQHCSLRNPVHRRRGTFSWRSAIIASSPPSAKRSAHPPWPMIPALPIMPAACGTARSCIRPWPNY